MDPFVERFLSVPKPRLEAVGGRRDPGERVACPERGAIVGGEDPGQREALPLFQLPDLGDQAIGGPGQAGVIRGADHDGVDFLAEGVEDRVDQAPSLAGADGVDRREEPGIEEGQGRVGIDVPDEDRGPVELDVGGGARPGGQPAARQFPDGGGDRGGRLTARFGIRMENDRIPAVRP